MHLKPSHLGLDGWFTFFLSALLLLLTAGTGLIYLGYRVYTTAKNTPCSPTQQPSLILLTGAALRNNQIQANYRCRLERCLKVINREQPQSVILLGGYTRGNTLSEAQAGKAFLQQHGVATKTILTEEHSQHTLENFQFARDMPILKNQPALLLISSRTHLHRCSVFARSLGLAVTLCAAEVALKVTRPLFFNLLLESLYLHWFYTGRAWSQLTCNRHSLKRIS